MKQTKAARFRQLYTEIERVCKDYTYEGVVEYLAKEKDLILTVNTFRSYLQSERKRRGGKLVITDDFVAHDINQSNVTEVDTQQTETKVIDDKQATLDAIKLANEKLSKPKSIFDKR